MKTRWGSCTPKTGAIRINARLAAYPPECLEFVVAHELVHLLEPSHNTRFHALLDEFCPGNRHPAKLLREAIRINARLAAYPPECLEFVVAHELVHLLEPSHNARFHALLDEFCPDNRHPAKLLREAPDSD